MYLGNVKIDEELGSGTFGSLFVGHLLEEERKKRIVLSKKLKEDSEEEGSRQLNYTDFNLMRRAQLVCDSPE